ncbi:hypothetical protein TNCV_2360831 [Trichonephila clavipes]|nr:hypothetical protein TNCV_2360831 [Trichonephila clavipes]
MYNVTLSLRSLFRKIRSWRSSAVKFIIEAASSNTSLITPSGFDKPAPLAAPWKVLYLVPLIVNKSSYDTMLSSRTMIPDQAIVTIFFNESLQ